MLTKDFIPEKEYKNANKLLYPKTVDDYWDEWIQEGTDYINTFIQNTAVTTTEMELYLKYYIQHRMFEITEAEKISADKIDRLDKMLETVMKNRENGIIGTGGTGGANVGIYSTKETSVWDGLF